MSLLWIIVLVVLVLAIAGSFPSWPHSATWGYGPAGGIGLLFLVLLLLILFGRI